MIYLKRGFFLVSISAVIAYSAYALNEPKHLDGKRTQPTASLTVREAPNSKENVVKTLAIQDSFEVSSGDWVKITTSDGKTGWALEKDVEKHLQNAYKASYQVEVSGSNKHYKVHTRSPEDVQKRLKESQQRAQKRLARMQDRFFHPFVLPTMSLYDDFFADDRVEQLEQKIQQLENKLAQKHS